MSLGSYGTNCYIVRATDAADCVIVDPGDEADRVLAALHDTETRCVAILVTHAHIDHIGAVGAVARSTGAPVYATASDAAILRDPPAMALPGAPVATPWDAEHLLVPGTRLDLASLAIDVIDTPGHAPGAVSLSIGAPDGDRVLVVGDVLFAGSVGRTDLPGGDWSVLEASIQRLVDACDHDIPVLPGHGPATTLRRELGVNPFLGGIRTDG